MVATLLGQSQEYHRLPDDVLKFNSFKKDFLTRCGTQGILKILLDEYEVMAQPRANEPAELKVRYKKEVDLKENRDAVAWQVLTEICKPKYEHLLTAFEDGAPDERCHQAWDHIVEWFEGQDDAPTRQRRIFEQAVTLRVKETGDPKQDWAVCKDQIDIFAQKSQTNGQPFSDALKSALVKAGIPAAWDKVLASFHMTNQNPTYAQLCNAIKSNFHLLASQAALRGKASASEAKEAGSKDEVAEAQAMLTTLKGVADPQLLAFLTKDTKRFYIDFCDNFLVVPRYKKLVFNPHWGCQDRPSFLGRVDS